MNPIQNPITLQIINFLNQIGIRTEKATLSEKTFLPGILIKDGQLFFDESAMLSPGDLLHEAGHLAVIPPGKRSQANDNVTDSYGDEMMAIGWSYAAALHLKIDPAVVFHPDGYRGGADSFLENFREGRFVGVPMLQWIGLTYDTKNAETAGVPPYPHMVKWVCDSEYPGE